MVARPMTGAGPSPGRGRDAGLADRLFVLSSPEELARAAAGRLWGIVREKTAPGGPGARFRVALSGGSTPRRTYETLSSDPYRDRFPWAAVHFFQVDERFVPAGDPRSNGRLLRETLFSRVPVPPGNVHLVDTALPDPAAAARRYEEDLRKAFAGPPAGFPRFDAVLLGLGADGHTASLFPGDEAVSEDRAWTVAVTARDGLTPAEGHGRPSAEAGRDSAGLIRLGEEAKDAVTSGSVGGPLLARVTLTLPVLCAAAQVIFLVSGSAKARSLRRLVERTGDDPAGRIVPRRGTITILADRDAAGDLESGGGKG